MAITQSTIYEEFVEFITSSPTLEEVASFHLSETADARIEELLDRSRDGTLAPDERLELDDYVRLEHLMRKAKIRAIEKLGQT